jgi:hypothetical protein
METNQYVLNGKFEVLTIANEIARKLETVNDFSQREHCASSATGENVKGTFEPL